MRMRMVPLLLAALILCGCSQGRVEPFTLEYAERLAASEAFSGSDMEQLDSDILVMLYGIDETTVLSCTGYLASNTSVSADELAVFVLTDEAAAVDAEAACRARISAQIAMCRDYCPNAVPRLEQALVERRDNTVLLAVGDEKAIAETLQSQ